jgi:uncharacterized protein (TIGR00369 family)
VEVDVTEGTTPEGATPFQRSLGLRWSVQDGVLTVDCDVTPDRVGPAGSLEGGIVSTLVDVAAGSAAARALGSLVATADLTVHFLAPVRVGPARATGVPVRVSKTGAVVEVRVVDRGAEDRLCSVALVDMRAIGPRPG